MGTATASKEFNHAEAFMLMSYATKDGSEREIIWNSRDGVTPFIIGSRRGQEMRHVDWQRDKRAVGHKPTPGERIFVDATEELLLPKLLKYVDEFWNHGEYPMSKTWETKEEAVASLKEDWLKPGAPTLVIVKSDGTYCAEGFD